MPERPRHTPGWKIAALFVYYGSLGYWAYQLAGYPGAAMAVLTAGFLTLLADL